MCLTLCFAPGRYYRLLKHRARAANPAMVFTLMHALLKLAVKPTLRGRCDGSNAAKARGVGSSAGTRWTYRSNPGLNAKQGSRAEATPVIAILPMRCSLAFKENEINIAAGEC